MLIRRPIFTIFRNLSTKIIEKNPEMSVKEIVKTLQSFAPLHLAESWDNVGLLVDPMTDKQVETILLTNDLTEDVVNEAKKHKAGLVISYHPNIFQGLKTVSDKYVLSFTHKNYIFYYQDLERTHCYTMYKKRNCCFFASYYLGLCQRRR